MKDIIYDNLPSLNIKLAKNKFLQSCYPMPAYMPEACTSFIKMIQQCLDNVISFASKDYMQNHRLAACTKELATTARKPIHC